MGWSDAAAAFRSSKLPFLELKQSVWNDWSWFACQPAETTIPEFKTELGKCPVHHVPKINVFIQETGTDLETTHLHQSAVQEVFVLTEIQGLFAVLLQALKLSFCSIIPANWWGYGVSITQWPVKPTSEMATCSVLNDNKVTQQELRGCNGMGLAKTEPSCSLTKPFFRQWQTPTEFPAPWLRWIHSDHMAMRRNHPQHGVVAKGRSTNLPVAPTKRSINNQHQPTIWGMQEHPQIDSWGVLLASYWGHQPARTIAIGCLVINSAVYLQL